MLNVCFKVLQKQFRKHLQRIIYPLHFTQVNNYATLFLNKILNANKLLDIWIIGHKIHALIAFYLFKGTKEVSFLLNIN